MQGRTWRGRGLGSRQLIRSVIWHLCWWLLFSIINGDECGLEVNISILSLFFESENFIVSDVNIKVLFNIDQFLPRTDEDVKVSIPFLDPDYISSKTLTDDLHCKVQVMPNNEAMASCWGE